MKRILIVEDEFQIGQAMKMLLEGDGFEVSYVSNGREGLEEIERQAPDLIILDLIMPFMNGSEFLTQLQRRKFKIPVVLMSEVETMASSVPRTWRRFLKKPFSISSLQAAVTSAL